MPLEVHPYGWLSIVPPLATVVAALITRRVLISLLLGLLSGAVITRWGSPGLMIYDLFETHLWATFIDAGKLRVLCFTLLMGAMIGVLNAGGGMQGLVRLLTPLTSTPRRGQVTTWFLGLVVFFDDYTNTLLLGNTMRATFDRLKMSREKLAYIVDSTAAPVACLAPLSVWVAFELSQISDGITNTQQAFGDNQPDWLSDLHSMDLFIACLPYRFYVIQALIFVLLVAWMKRDLGPMIKAERRARSEDSTSLEDKPEDPLEQTPATHWSNALLPIAVTLTVVVVLILADGWQSASESMKQAQAANGLQGIADQTPPSPGLRDIVGEADAAFALMYGALTGLLFASGWLVMRGVLTSAKVGNAAYVGMRAVIPALAILWFAGAMSRMTGFGEVPDAPPPAVAEKTENTEPAEQEPLAGGATIESQAKNPYPFKHYRLYTGAFLKELLPSGEGAASLTASLLPTAVFLLACLIAFSTGTSFGTMGILLPVVVPISIATLTRDGAALDPENPLLLASIGSVLAGAIFGDHCSPISDTTILSSQASGCDHIAHVVTQMPYAVAAGLVSAAGILAVGFGVNVWISLAVQTVALVVVLRVFGKNVDDPAVTDLSA